MVQILIIEVKEHQISILLSVLRNSINKLFFNMELSDSHTIFYMCMLIAIKIVKIGSRVLKNGNKTV